MTIHTLPHVDGTAVQRQYSVLIMESNKWSIEWRTIDGNGGWDLKEWSARLRDHIEAQSLSPYARELEEFNNKLAVLTCC